ncbi:hypothetical protein Tco_0798879 [Tanacetum coccineum]
MVSYYHSTADHCNHIVTQLLNKTISYPLSLVNVTSDDLNTLLYFCAKGYESEANEKFSRPLMWVGVYIAIASLFCILAMLADLVYCIWKEIFQVPCRYFSLNAASITAISVTMKLTLDMTGPMPGSLDHAAKLGSVVFMCIMIANLNPSLASMENKRLLANIIGLAILVITIAVNMSIEIYTGVIGYEDSSHLVITPVSTSNKKPIAHGVFATIASINIALMLFLLLISTSSAIIIPSFKKILEFKYYVGRKALQHSTGRSTIEDLTNRVTRYWIMAKTGSPQFVMAGTSLFYASCVICSLSIQLYIAVLLFMVFDATAWNGNYESAYRWSIPIILITQFIGIVIGTSTLAVRCIRSMRFKKYDAKFRVEKYWTEMLHEWKGSHIAFLSSDRRTRTFVHNMKNIILSLCIGLQIAFIKLCQIIGLFGLYSFAIAMVFTKSNATTISDDRRKYVLHLEDEVQIFQRVLEGFLRSITRLIEKAKEQQSDNLLKLLEKSNGFTGVQNFDDSDQNFDIDQIRIPSSIKLNSWSLPVVTLTCIAIVVPDIHHDEVDRLFKSIDEALFYTQLMDKISNIAHEYVHIRKTTMALWYELKDNCKWLENPMDSGDHGAIPTKILDSFAGKAKEVIVTEIRASTNVERFYPSYRLIAAHSMHRISRSLLSKYQNGVELSTNDKFFQLLSSMIADILYACLTNIPRVIKMKCHESTIEKREASVEAAAKLLGRSMKIIKKLDARQLPIMDPVRMVCIDEWRLQLNQSIP